MVKEKDAKKKFILKKDLPFAPLLAFLGVFALRNCFKLQAGSSPANLTRSFFGPKRWK
jgi:hypothetical protein